MADECPRDCLLKHEVIASQVKAQERVLHGSDGVSGIAGAMSKFITKSGVMAWIVILAGVVCAFGVYALNSSAEQKKRAEDISGRLLVHEEKFNQSDRIHSDINNNLRELRLKQESVMQNQKVIMTQMVTAEEIKKILTDIVNNSNKAPRSKE